MEKWTYALLLLGSIFIPLIRSFESRIYFKGNWPALFAGIFVMMLIFIPWDIWFTAKDVWHFNHDYVSGLYIAGLPIEEWLFFIIIPYAVMFTYEVLRYFFPQFYFPVTVLYLTLALAVFMIVLAVVHHEKTYTVIVTSITALLLIVQLFVKSWKTWLSHYYLGFAVSIIPFMIVNGVLTAFPVVIYNNSENLAIRLTTIPVEDFAYLMSMMLLVMMIYERLLKKKRNTKTYAM
ncbi:MAG: lycopene cyclase domain-containing protein [Bacteroidales bacterium]|nr:lycopene cyclase domain-containing protein [Bacteroidales bacterium]